MQEGCDVVDASEGPQGGVFPHHVAQPSEGLGRQRWQWVTAPPVIGEPHSPALRHKGTADGDQGLVLQEVIARVGLPYHVMVSSEVLDKEKEKINYMCVSLCIWIKKGQ